MAEEKTQLIHHDSGDYESVPIDNLCIGDVGVCVRYQHPYSNPEVDANYIGKPFVLGADQIIFFHGVYVPLDSVRPDEKWIVRKLRPGEKITITGV